MQTNVVVIMGNLTVFDPPAARGKVDANPELRTSMRGIDVASPYSGRVFCREYPEGVIFLDSVRGMVYLDHARNADGRDATFERLKDVGRLLMESLEAKAFPCQYTVFINDEKVSIKEAKNYLKNLKEEDEEDVDTSTERAVDGSGLGSGAEGKVGNADGGASEDDANVSGGDAPKPQWKRRWSRRKSNRKEDA